MSLEITGETRFGDVQEVAEALIYVRDVAVRAHVALNAGDPEVGRDNEAPSIVGGVCVGRDPRNGQSERPEAL